ncbi:MAG: response regulator transcription factor [Blastopirellula sp.]|nr:response regulator transcription factor [Blastopirellula sp.]
MSELKTRLRILIVDDHPIVRDGLNLRISAESDLEVCGEAENVVQALEKVEATRPDLVIVDIALKASHGLELIEQLAAKFPQVKMLVVSGFEESLYAERAVRAGANGYLNKQESNEKLIEAIRVVMRGDCYLSEAMKQRMLARVVRRRTVGSSPAELLTNREMEIFRLIGSGMTTSAIANQLFLSPHTLDSHRENIKKKLGVRNAAELNRQAVQWVLEHG